MRRKNKLYLERIAKYREIRQKNGKMCAYCNNEKHIEEMKEDKIFLLIYGRHLRLIGKVFNIKFGRDMLINYCPMCGRKLTN